MDEDYREAGGQSMIFNLLGLIAGPLMIGTDIGLLVVLGWIWMVSACIGVVWFLGALIMGMFNKY